MKLHTFPSLRSAHSGVTSFWIRSEIEVEVTGEEMEAEVKVEEVEEGVTLSPVVTIFRLDGYRVTSLV
jgi:hypothetical protein